MKTDVVRAESSCLNRGFRRKLESSSEATTSPPSHLLGFPGPVGSHRVKKEGSTLGGLVAYTFTLHRAMRRPAHIASFLPSSPPPRSVQLLSLASPMGLPPMQFALHLLDWPSPLIERIDGALGLGRKTTTLLHEPRPAL